MGRDGLDGVGFGEGARALVEHGQRPVGVGQAVEPVGRAATHDAHTVGLVELGQIDPGQHALEQVGFVAAEVELAQQLAGAGPDACRHRALDEALGGGVVAVEEGEACHVEHELGIDLTAAVEPPGDEPHPVVPSPGTDRFDAVGQLATQPAAAQRRQLVEDDLGEERVSEGHRGPPPRRADLQQAAVLEVFEDAGPDDARERVEGDLAGHRQQLGGVVVCLVQAPEALGDQILERRGRLDRPDEVPHAVVHRQGAGVPGGLDELAEDPGVAHGQVPEPGEGTGHQRATEGTVEDRLDALLRQRLDREPAQVLVLDEVIEGRRSAARAHREDREHGAGLHERSHQRPREVIELVTVVDQQEQALVSGMGAHRRSGPVEHPGAVELIRTDGRGDVGRQQVSEGGERDRPTLGMPGGASARQPGGIGELDDLVRQPGLADARAAGEEDAAGALVPEPRRQDLELAAATDQGPCGIRRRGGSIRCRDPARRRPPAREPTNRYPRP